MSDIQNTNITEGKGLSTASKLAAAGVVVSSLFMARAARAVTPALTFADIPGTGDVHVLNFALLLEDLESALYRAALKSLNASGNATGPLFTYLTKFSRVETDHATFLRAAITAASATPIRKLADNEFSFGLTGASTPAQVLELVLQAEATGVRAYLGAIPFFSAASPYLQTAAAIQGTEARHTTTLTIIRNIYFSPLSDTAPLASETTYSNFSYDAVGYNPAKPNEGYKGIDVHLQPDTVLAAVSPFFINKP